MGVNRPFTPRFYNRSKESYFEHPYILISAAHHYKTHPDCRRSLQIDDDTKVFVDSGGYQLATEVISPKKYNNKIALDWSEKTGNIFPILDHPITHGCDRRERLKTSGDAAQYYVENRSAPNKEILNVVSASDIDGARWWYDGIKQYKLDGWAHGGHRGNVTPILQTFLLLGTQGEFNRGYTVPYHIFGVSSQVALIYFSTMQREATKLGWDVQIMSDSSSFQFDIGHGGYVVSTSWTGFQRATISNKFNYDNLDPNIKLPCKCKVCANITDTKEFMTNPKQFYLLGAIHNLGKLLDYKDMVDNIIHCGVDEIADNSFPSHVVRNIKAIREAFADPIVGIDSIGHTFTHRDIKEGRNHTMEAYFE